MANADAEIRKLYFFKLPCMIAFLSGTVRAKNQRTLILDVQGVGYQVFATRSFIEGTPIGERLELYIHTHVREDALHLFGFPTAELHQFFLMLMSVSGIGPKLALDILEAPFPRLHQAIAQKDIAFLASLPGIGKKTAERIAIDLADKVLALPQGLGASAATVSQLDSELIDAIERLGYRRQQIIPILRDVPRSLNTPEEIIKYFLQHV